MERPENDNGSAGLARWSGWVATAWALSYLYLGLTSNPPQVDVAGLERLDLAVHAVASVLLVVLIAEWMITLRGATLWYGVVGGMTASVGVGLFIELAQIFTPTRTFSVTDLVSDLGGALLGAVVFVAAAVDSNARQRVTSIVVVLGVMAVITVLGSLAWR